ncbi:MAG: terminase family protein [Gammaproteobacteria bacterium]|nr:terminase family protein [Gammaproteobacteria bacterium]
MVSADTVDNTVKPKKLTDKEKKLAEQAKIAVKVMEDAKNATKGIRDGLRQGQCYVDGKYVPTPGALAYYQWVVDTLKKNPDGDFIHGNYGPQTEFLTTTAQICIYGGQAAGGKSFAGLMYPTQFMHLPNFTSIMFRRETTDLTKPKGLQEEANMLYEPMGGVLNKSTHSFDFSKVDWMKNPTIQLGHIQHEKNVEDWKGSQLCLAYFDELTTFTELMFWFIFGRCRTSSDPRKGCPMDPIMRATTNPDYDSFVRRLIDWWIDSETGLAIKERSGVIRWLARDPSTGHIEWGDTKEEMQLYINQFYKDTDPEWVPEPISFTFIHAEIKDNPYMSKKDLSRLAALSPLERARQEYGDWNASGNGGGHFKREWCVNKDKPYKKPHQVPETVRSWWGVDCGYSEKTADTDPDYTCLVQLGRDDTNGDIYIMNCVKAQVESTAVPGIIHQAFAQNQTLPAFQAEGISIPQDPAGGKGNVSWLVPQLLMYNVHTSTEKAGSIRGDAKLSRLLKFASQCKHGNVYIVEGDWNQWLENQLIAYPEGKHDDAIDAVNRAMEQISKPGPEKFNLSAYL